ncbi:MAG: sodium:alanine symporter family protein [Gemmatimonadales bacterium]|nr:MAG: sodium:alanine symporter family protein [Gemmatimonadales bacterium]
MEAFRSLVDTLEGWVWSSGIPVGDETIPFVVILLLGAGIYFTLRLGFVQIRHLGHGFAVTSGRYDDPAEPGDVTHFQALSTALSATVGIGNIAGVAIAIHWGGPGALFWMWVTAFLGMATKFAEVTLAQYYRDVKEPEPGARMWEGTVSGGPMYYIERGLGKHWKPAAVFFAVALGFTAFLTGNGVQANTVADTLRTEFGLTPWISGILTASVVAAVIIGGIARIGKVTGILAPAMAAIYVAGALFIIVVNWDQILPSFALIFTEAFNPSAGVAGVGVGAFLVTMMWGVRRGLFSNEAGQGSAPIAHAAAKTDEPVSEGVVALLEPFIDTIVICTMTALVIIITGAWGDRVPTTITFTGGHMSFVEEREDGRFNFFVSPPESVEVLDGYPVATDPGDPRMAWHEAPVERFWVDPGQTEPFTGVIRPGERVAEAEDGTTYPLLYANAPQNGAPLTMLAFQRGLPGDWGHYIVILTVLLFGISTAIAWSYYGDRCAYYLFGEKAVLPYKLIFVGMHFVGAVVPLAVAWTLGDIFLGLVIIPNLIAVVVLTPKVKEITNSYFKRKPWVENAEVHRRVVEEGRRRKE